MPIKFQADADLDMRIPNGLKRVSPGIDFQTANQARLRGLSDHEVLQRAAKADRILVSHDRQTMSAHFLAFVEMGESPGLIIVPQNIALARIIEDLHLIALPPNRRTM